MVELPTGTVTLLFSDIEGSTRLLSRLGSAYVQALDGQRTVLRRAWREHGGTELGTEGDSFYVVFPTAEGAVSAAMQAQRDLSAYPWPSEEPVRARMGMHTGAPIPHDGAYVGMDVHRAARIAGAAHGGQVTLSASTAELVAPVLPADSSLRDLGRHRLKDLPRPEHIYQLDSEGLDKDFPPLRSLGASSTLPLAEAPLLGRESEIDALRALIDGGARLATLTGPGGVGKTSLAVELARALMGKYPDGAYFVPLVTVTEAGAMWASILATLGTSADGNDEAAAVIDFLTDRAIVLVLDNLEQVAGADTVASRLLRSVAGLTVVATSRRPLHVLGEQEFAVPALPLPVDFSKTALDASPAVQLFVRHAQRVRPSFSLSTQTAGIVVAICRSLDGLPLAIELAAARSKLLSPQAILARLGTALDIDAAEATRPDRHRNLRATIDWSYQLLDPVHQRFFRQLGVFTGGADLSAVEAVCTDGALTLTDPLDLVVDIVDASLATVAEDADGEPRVALLETVRAFAAGQLDLADPEQTTRDRHARYFLQFVRDETARLSTADHVRARAKLATEHANICAALGWTLEGGVKRRDIGLEIATKMGYHWNSSGRLTDTDLWLTKVVNLGAPDGPALAQCLAILANSLRILGKEPNRQARLATESVTMLRRLGEADALPYALRTLAAVEWERGDIPAARILYDELITTVRDLGDPSTISVALEEVSGFETSHGSLERALQLAGEAHEIATEVGGVGEAGTRHNLACILRLVGRVDEAESMQRQAIPVLLAYDYSYLADVAADYAAILAELGHDDLAARLMGSADGWHELTGVQREDTQTALIAGAIDAARTRLPQEKWEALYQAGHDALVEDELAHALAVVTERSSEASVG